MRSDMAKVIVERPRHKPFNANKKYRQANLDWDDLPSKEGMRRPYRNAHKDLNENLAPLERYLRKQVGRHWNKVYQEICANLRVDSVVQRHVRHHVWDFVARHVKIVDGKVYNERWLGWRYNHQMSKGEMYVHPTTDILTEVKR